MSEIGIELMIINGLRKLTLLDYPGRVACTVFLAGCNLRCPFCHNAPLVTDTGRAESIDEDELIAFLKKRQGLLDGVCVSGGEPTLRPELPKLLRRIKTLGYAVKLDTNGTSPEMLSALIDGGVVDFVAMDIKNSPEKYSMTVGVENFDILPVKCSAQILLRGTIPYEFRTTVVRGFHTASDFEAIGRWLVGAVRYYLQNFVDSGNLIDPQTTGCEKDEMEDFLATLRQYIPAAELRGL